MTHKSKSIITLFIAFLSISSLLFSCSDNNNIGPEAQAQREDNMIVDHLETDLGLTFSESYFKDGETNMYYTIQETGDGRQTEEGDSLVVDYTGWVLYNQTLPFDSSELTEPISLIQGNGSVIEGWEKALLMMRAGDERTYYIPSTLAYGEAGRGSSIPPNSTLVFNMKLREVLTPTP